MIFELNENNACSDCSWWMVLLVATCTAQLVMKSVPALVYRLIIFRLSLSQCSFGEKKNHCKDVEWSWTYLFNFTFSSALLASYTHKITILIDLSSFFALLGVHSVFANFTTIYNYVSKKCTFETNFCRNLSLGHVICSQGMNSPVRGDAIRLSCYFHLVSNLCNFSCGACW